MSSGTIRNALVGRPKEKTCFYFQSEVLSAQREARTETEKRVFMITMDWKEENKWTRGESYQD